MFTQNMYPIPQLAPSIYSDIPFLEIGIDWVVKLSKNQTNIQAHMNYMLESSKILQWK